MTFEIYALTMYSLFTVPVAQVAVSAGEPAMLDGELQRRDLNTLLTDDPDSCLLLKVRGTCLEDIPIRENDWILLDRTAKPEDGDLIVFRLGEGFGCKVFKKNERGKPGLYLVPKSDSHKPREVKETDDFAILGTVRYVIHSLKYALLNK